MYGIFTYILGDFLGANGLGRRPFLSHPGPLVRATSRAPPFSPKALTDRVILLNDRRTVMRREPCEIPNGCVPREGMAWDGGGSFQRLSYMLHGAGIFTNICPKNHPVM